MSSSGCRVQQLAIFSKVPRGPSLMLISTILTTLSSVEIAVHKIFQALAPFSNTNLTVSTVH